MAISVKRVERVEKAISLVAGLIKAGHLRPTINAPEAQEAMSQIVAFAEGMHDGNVDPTTGARQDVVFDQDLKNGMSSVLEFCAEAFRMNDPDKARDYLLQVSRDIASGKGHPAPNPGPVEPTAKRGKGSK